MAIHQNHRPLHHFHRLRPCVLQRCNTCGTHLQVRLRSGGERRRLVRAHHVHARIVRRTCLIRRTHRWVQKKIDVVVVVVVRRLTTTTVASARRSATWTFAAGIVSTLVWIASGVVAAVRWNGRVVDVHVVVETTVAANRWIFGTRCCIVVVAVVRQIVLRCVDSNETCFHRRHRHRHRCTNRANGTTVVPHVIVRLRRCVVADIASCGNHVVDVHARASSPSPTQAPTRAVASFQAPFVDTSIRIP